MALCFQLTPKGAKHPATLQSVDDRLWRELGNKEPSKSNWYLGWFHSIGLALASGKSFMGVSEHMEKCALEASDLDESNFYAQLVEVVEFLSTHYTVHSFWSR
jgi:hypothetical protein